MTPKDYPIISAIFCLISNVIEFFVLKNNIKLNIENYLIFGVSSIIIFPFLIEGFYQLFSQKVYGLAIAIVCGIILQLVRSQLNIFIEYKKNIIIITGFNVITIALTYIGWLFDKRETDAKPEDKDANLNKENQQKDLIANLNKENEQKDNLVENLEDDAKQKDEKIANLNKKNQKQNNLIENLKNDSKQKDKEIANLNKENQQKNNLIENLQNDSKQKDKKIANLNKENKSLFEKLKEKILPKKPISKPKSIINVESGDLISDKVYLPPELSEIEKNDEGDINSGNEKVGFYIKIPYNQQNLIPDEYANNIKKQAKSMIEKKPGILQHTANWDDIITNFKIMIQKSKNNNDEPVEQILLEKSNLVGYCWRSFPNVYLAVINHDAQFFDEQT